MAADLLLQGPASVLTCADGSGWDPGVVEDASVVVEDGRVTGVVPASEDLEAEEVLDVAGTVIAPGFVDAHTHPAFAGDRSEEFLLRSRGEDYESIARAGGGILSTADAVAEEEEGGLAELVRRRFDTALWNGTTTIEAKSGYGLDPAEELKSLRSIRSAAEGHPIRAVPTFLGLHAVPRDTHRAAYLDRVLEETLPAVVEEGLATSFDAFVEGIAFSVDEARRACRAASDAGLFVRLHAGQLSSMGAVGLAAEVGAASADHLEFVEPAEIEALAAAGTVPVCLPAAGHFLRMEVDPPARALIDAGLPLAVATDFNPGSAPMLSMPETLHLARLRLGLDWHEALRAGTRNAAQSLGLDDVGWIGPGSAADMVVLDLDEPSHLGYWFGTDPVIAVVAGGQVVRT